MGISNDGFLSRLNSRASTWLGVDMLEYERHGPVAPRQQIVDFVRDTGRSIIVFPDAGGPYRQLKPGLISIARQTGAALVPVALKATPSVVVGSTMRHRVPTPFAKLEARWGTPVPETEASAATVEAALHVLDEPTK